MASSAADPRILPTEVNMDFRNRLLWGEVHDPNAYLMNGVAGHAGLFSSVPDMARFCYTMLMGGVAPNGRRLFRSQTVAEFTTRVKGDKGDNHRRALGWDMKPSDSKCYTSSGSLMSSSAFGAMDFLLRMLLMFIFENLVCHVHSARWQSMVCNGTSRQVVFALPWKDATTDVVVCLYFSPSFRLA